MRSRAITGRTMAESTPAFDPPPRPPAGAPNVVLVVLDDLGFAQLGCFGSDIDTPDDRRPRRRRRCASTASTSRRCARRPAPACSPAATTTPSAWASSPTSRSASPATTRASRAAPARCRASCATPATAPSPSASGTWRRAGSRRASGPFERWPLGLGFERYYGFLNGDTNQWTPELVRDNGFVDPPRTPERGLPPHRGPRRPGDPHDPGPAAGDARQAVLPLLRARRDARAAPRAAASGSSATAAASTTAGRRGGRAPSRARSQMGIVPAGTDARPSGRRGFPPGRRCRPSSAACSPA